MSGIIYSHIHILNQGAYIRVDERRGTCYTQALTRISVYNLTVDRWQTLCKCYMAARGPVKVIDRVLVVKAR